MKVLQLFFVLLIASSTYATTYYVGGNTHPTHPGDGSLTYPWKTIGQVNSFASFVPGDVILFKRGSSYYGSILVKSHGLNFGAYGTGTNPVIHGVVLVSGWTNVSGNIWEATISSAPANHKLALFLHNEVVQELGRYPNPLDANGGFLDYNAFPKGQPNAKTRIIDRDASGILSGAWVGAEVCVKKNQYTLERNTVTAITGDTIDFVAGPTINPYTVPDPLFEPLDTAYGYYLQNSDLTLDRQGEWYYDPATKKIRAYFTAAPAANTTKAALLDRLIDLNYKNNITISGINFYGANKFGVYGQGDPSGAGTRISGATISNCNFSFIGGRGIGLYGGDSCIVDSCTFNWCLSTAVQMYWSTSGLRNRYCTVKNCSITNTAPYPGMAGYSDIADNDAIHAYSTPLLIEKNSINNVGKAGIFWTGDNVIVQKNAVQNAMLQFSDYGAIYTWADVGQTFTNRTVASNVIWDCPGNAYGTNSPNAVNAKGIYLDGRTMNVSVDQNTIYNIRSTGISSNNPTGINITGNTLYNNPIAITFARLKNLGATNLGLTISGNICYSTDPSHRNLNYVNTVSSSSAFDGLPTAVSIYGNKYGEVNPVPFTVDASAVSISTSPMSLSTWQASSGQDTGSQVIAPIKQYTVNSYASGNLITIGQNGQFNTTGSEAGLNPFPNPTPPTSTTYLSRAWDASGGGSLNLTMNNPAPNKYPYINAAFGTAINNANNYIFRFTTLGSLSGGIDRGIVRAFLRKVGGVYDNLIPTQTHAFGSTLTQHEFYFSHPASYATCGFVIELEGNSGATTYIDNIELYEANVTDIPVSDVVKFYPNPSMSSSGITLPAGNYINVADGTVYSGGSYSVAANSNLLYIRNPGSYRPAPVAVAPVIKTGSSSIQCYPNPARNIVNIAGLTTAGDWQTVSITSFKGEQTGIVKNIIGQAQVKVDISSLAAGQYFAVLKNRKGTSVTLKFIKL